ncbi:Folate-sensitive fragile site protein Fra10Ac1 protein [Dioscorea alata]|uniref:Folate-sensitive fragile site protein Fra10Ac1 protein n=1 Tax=Dioscorea alata TaxID=55571 RepID=A0ACB7VA46_DIOAL|nr:Folate-sensitive fragile site protein Fra10Ac1 protein [Dioscorea alata]
MPSISGRCSSKGEHYVTKRFSKFRCYGNSKNTHEILPIKTGQDTIRENYRFIVNKEDDMDSTWKKRLVKYCIADMSHNKKKQGMPHSICLRWRTEKEVVSGKVCVGNKHCDEKDGLGSYDVLNFSYLEAGENKQALVKLVACKRCAENFVYKRQKEKERSEAQAKDKEKRKRERTRHDESSEDGYSGNPDRRKKEIHNNGKIDDEME